MHTLKIAFRSLLKTPIVSTVAVLSIALGIGANVAIFSIFNETLLRPLPVHEPDRLVNFSSPGPRGDGSVSCGPQGNCDGVFSYPAFRDLERLQSVFTGMAAHRNQGANIAFEGSSEGAESLLVSGSYFTVLGLAPQVGRLIDNRDERGQGGGNVVVLSDDYWRRRFAGRTDIIDKVLLVNGRPMTIVGVAPRGFYGTTIGVRPAIFAPASMREALLPGFKGLDSRTVHWLYMFARLKPGVSIEQARAAVNALYRPMITDVEAPLMKFRSENMRTQFLAREMQLEPGRRGQSSLPRETRQPLTVLFSVTMIVLLICCANVANLLLGRAAARSTEMAVRLSIGAGRRHIVVQLLAESLLLAAIGGAAGLLVARWTLTGIAAMLPGQAQNLSLQLDGEMLLYAAALSLVTGLLFGLFPAVHSTRPNLVDALKANAGQPSGAKAATRFRVTLATAQIALSMALLISAGLFTKSLSNITRVDLGLNPDKLVVFGIAPELNGYEPHRNHEIFARVEERLATLPGVTGVTSSMVRFASGDNWNGTYTVQGFEPAPDADLNANYTYVGQDFLPTMGIRLMSGRGITRDDTLTTPKVVVVNEAFTKKFNLGRDAVGKRLRRGRGTDLDHEIIGVAANSTYSEVKGEVRPIVMYAYRQHENIGSTNFYVRTSGSEAELMASIPRVVREIDPTLPIADLQTMSVQVLQNVSLDRIVTSMSAAFATLATLLAALGLYGVIAYTVSQRTREFGLRMALGADSANVRRLVLRQVGTMTGVGAAIGLASAYALGRAAESLLFQMDARDPVVFTVATVLLAMVATVAGLIPAQRAANVDPMTALRYE